MGERKDLRAQALREFESRGVLDMGKIEKIIATIAETYTSPPTDVPRLAYWDVAFATAQLYAEQKQHRKAIEYALKCLTSLGYVIEGGKRASLV